MAGGSTTGPGAIRVADGIIELNADRTDDERIELVIVNTGDRPVQIGSHIHLPDVNPALDFDRVAAQGFRLDIPSGTSRRFEPGASRTVAAVALRGRREVPGIACGPTCSPPSGSAEPGRTTDGRALARRVRGALRTRPSETRSGSATPICGSRSSRTAPPAARRPSSAAASRSASRWPRAPPPGPRAHRTPSSPTRSCWTTGGSSGPTSASGTAGSSALGRAGNPDIADGVAPRPADRRVHRRHLR